MVDGYKFVGVVNLFDIYPDFLFPIYQKGEDFFFHNGEKNRIYNFDYVTKSVRKKIIFLHCKEICIINMSKKEYFFVHDTPIYAFQSNDKEIICCDLGDMIKYLNEFKTEDTILIKQINSFITENILQYGIGEFFRYFSQPPFFYHQQLLDINQNNELSLKLYGNEKNNKIDDMVLKFTNYADSYMPEQHIYFNFKQRIRNMLKRDLIYTLNHEMYHLDYCECRLQKMYTIEADFRELKRDFDKVIKKLNYDSLYYNICIKCQNAVINRDENELIILINENRQVLSDLEKENILEDYLWNYIQNHIYNFAFELS